MKKIVISLLLMLGLTLQAAQAEIIVRITDGIDDSLPIIIAPFSGDGQAARIIEADLKRSGRFKLVSAGKAGQRFTLGQPINAERARQSGADYVVLGQYVGGTLNFELVSTASGQSVARFRIPQHPNRRRMAHKAADLLFQKMTGLKGAFDTRIAYILASGAPGNQTFRLMVSDADGYAPKTVLTSRKPIMSPTWSPNAKMLAYSSFENDHAAVFLQDLKSGRKQVLLSYEGTNGAPAWSPDGSRLAISLSKEDNTDIYVVNARSGAVRRVTRSRAIDTEPAWSGVGHLIYTSDQGGKPQLYRTAARGGDGRRITFQGDYNSAASVFKNKVAMVRQMGSRFRIAIMNASNKESMMVSKGSSDESPSLAPNGTMVVYATRSGGREVLAISSDNGKASQFLPVSGGSARDPAWSPYLP